MSTSHAVRRAHLIVLLAAATTACNSGPEPGAPPADPPGAPSGGGGSGRPGTGGSAGSAGAAGEGGGQAGASGSGGQAGGGAGGTAGSGGAGGAGGPGGATGADAAAAPDAPLPPLVDGGSPAQGACSATAGPSAAMLKLAFKKLQVAGGSLDSAGPGKSATGLTEIRFVPGAPDEIFVAQKGARINHLRL